MKYRELFSSFGLGLIFTSIYLLDSRVIPSFPNCYTLLPTVGTALIIIFSNETTFIGRTLAHPILRWIGLISYSLYLWHQPVFAYLRIRYTEEPGVQDYIICISIVIVLSVLTYFLVEQPFRNKEFLNRVKIFLFALTASAIIFMCSLFLMRTAFQRNDNVNSTSDSYIRDLHKFAGTSYVISAYENHHRKFPKFSNSTKKKLLLIGDSFSQDLFNMIVEGKYLTDYEICMYFTVSYCQIYIGNEDRLKFIDEKHRATCSKGNDVRVALPMIHQANAIILASRWFEWSVLRLPTTIKSMNLTKSQKIIVIGTKSFGSVQPRRYVNTTLQYRLRQRNKPTEHALTAHKAMLKTVDKSIFVNLMDTLCPPPDGTCSLFTPKGKLISYDGYHLTKFGALYIGNFIFHRKPLNQL